MSNRIFYISRVTIIALTLMCLLFLFPYMPELKQLQASLDNNEDTSKPAHPNKFLSPDVTQDYIQRGDWELPDILLLAEDFDWHDSLEIIVAAAHQDGMPVYIMSNQNDFQKEDYLWVLNNQYEAEILRVSYDTPWIRDYGPLQLKESGNRIHWLDFGYTDERPYDDAVPQQLADYMDMPIENGDYYLEGGAIASVDPDNVEEFNAFRQELGCRAIAVLPAITGESTGHADIIAQFFSSDIVAVAVVDQDVSSEISAELVEAAASLAAAAHSIGQRLRIIRLPIHVEGENFYSYVNGTRLRKAYLVPSFKNVPLEKELMAYDVIRSAIPEVRLIQIPSDKMVERGGAVHCITLGLNLPKPHGLKKYWVEMEKSYPLQAISTLKKRKNSSRY
jgi:agmatine deiminase